MEAKKPKTAPSKKSIQTAREVWPYVKAEYAAAHQAKAEGKPVVWSCAIIPKELYWAMDLCPVFPEHYAVLTGMMRRDGTKDESVEKEAVRFARIAEAAGFSSYLCGYARSSIGHVLTGDLSDAPLGGLPKPDLIVTTSFVCDLRGKWLRYLAQKLNVPFYILDIPERGCDIPFLQPGLRTALLPFYNKIRRGERDLFFSPVADHELDYTQKQWEELVTFIENVTGHKYDQDRFNEALDLSYKTNELRLEILELRKAVPAPMGVADGLTVMYPGLYTLGTQRAYDFYVRLRQELRDRVANGLGVIEEEKFRLLWMGLAPWFNMSLFNYFEKYGGVFAFEPIYNMVPFPPRMPEKPMRELAVRTLQQSGGLIAPSMIGQAVSTLVNAAHEYRCSGAVLFYLITCRPVVYPTVEIARVLQEDFGIPSVPLECDLIDERTYSEAQTLARFDAFAEQLLKRAA
ncbi:MAG: 2-hydroxyacyl-CoA dehydratase [Deltaproteobacteria bacterium]|nr:2-hydroxyacyl-CoA dehydratase [Deltaproteobacteria bacterium]